MTPTPPDRFARRTLFLCALTAAGELGLVLSVIDWNAFTRFDGPMLLFIAGPPVFLALIAWRRRAHPTRARTFFRFAVGVSAFGVFALAAHSVQFHTNPRVRDGVDVVPSLVALVQWVAVLIVWIATTLRESAEKSSAGSSSSS